MSQRLKSGLVRWWPTSALASLLAGCSPADPLNFLAPVDGLAIQQSISYGEGPRRTLDVYQPRNASRAPVIVFFYGGSWQGGVKETYRFVAAALASRGHVVIVPDYRVYPDVRYPSFLEDAAQAVRWAKQNALRYGGDPEKLFLMGHSAGGHIALTLGTDGRWLQAQGLDARSDLAGLIGVSGPYDFLPIKDQTLKVIFGGDNRPETQPISYVVGGEAPALLVTGQTDDSVDPDNASRLAARFAEKGSDARVIIYPRVGHLSIVGAFAFPLRFLAPVLDDVDAFVRRTGSRVRLAPTAQRSAP